MPLTLLLPIVLGAPPAVSGAVCPGGMRLVEGDHYDRVDYECREVKWGFCASYVPGVARASGRHTHERVCMDEYEAPNAPGAVPIVMRTGAEAASFCEQRGKRLCTE